MRLEIDNLSKRFGGVVALEEVCVEFWSGQVTAVIGPNGAGKTTLFNVISGNVAPDSGTIRLVTQESEHALDFEPPHRIAAGGIGVLSQDVSVFATMPALDNICVGFQSQVGEAPWNVFLRAGAVSRQESSIKEKARALLEFVGLGDRENSLAGDLSYGQQKLLALARLLAAEPDVILLDEPTAGMHHTMVERILSLIRSLAEEDGKAVVIIEHNLNVVRRIGSWVYLMASGRVEVFGQPDEVLHDNAIRAHFPNI